MDQLQYLGSSKIFPLKVIPDDKDEVFLPVLSYSPGIVTDPKQFERLDLLHFQFFVDIDH